MTNKPQPQACFFVSRNKISFYSLERESVIDLPLSAEITQDLEIISKNSLERILRNWLEQHKIFPDQVALILDSTVYFHQTLDAVPESNVDPVVQNFLEIVPFSEVLVETFPLQKGAYITGINRNFINPLVSTLEKVGFVIVSISPAFIFGIDLTKNPFSPDIAEKMLSNEELLLSYSFLSEKEVEMKLFTPQPFLSVQLNAKLIVLAMIFIALIGILIALLMMQGAI